MASFAFWVRQGETLMKINDDVDRIALPKRGPSYGLTRILQSLFAMQHDDGCRFFSSGNDSAINLGGLHDIRPCVVVMGVAGCGKSSLAQRCAREWSVPLLEGDDFHTQNSLNKMRSGLPLSDEDRAIWLDLLALKLRQSEHTGVVAACSALRQRYRDVLRAALPGLRFVFLSISQEHAYARVASRPAHLFPPSLVASQFETLEDPRAEPDVLVLDAILPTTELANEVTRWLQQGQECMGSAT